MSTQEDSQGPAIRALFEQLSVTASSLNEASDRLNEHVEHLESALQKFNLGISCWENFAASGDDEFPRWRREQIGYARFKDGWRIGLRKLSGHENYPQNDEKSEWPFTDAPREMRVRASQFFALLIVKLNEQAKATAQELSARTIDIQQLTSAIDSLFDPLTLQAARPSGKMEPPPTARPKVMERPPAAPPRAMEPPPGYVSLRPSTFEEAK
jgi:hypothetical protein